MNSFILIGVCFLIIQVYTQSSTQHSSNSISILKDLDVYKNSLINSKTCSLYDSDESETAKLKNKRPKCTAEGCNIPLNCHNYTTSNATLGEAQVVQVTPFQLQSILEDVNVVNSCALVMFYAPWCEYSVRFAARFNMVGRIYKELPVLAVDLSVSDP